MTKYVIRNKLTGKYWTGAIGEYGFIRWTEDLQRAWIFPDKPIHWLENYEEKVKVKIDPVSKEVSLG